MARKSTKSQIPPTGPSARTSLEILRAQGFTDSQIGKKLGRDSSYIRQVRTGSKPGSSLTDAAAKLAAGEKTVSAPERRKTKSGKNVRVRGEELNEVSVSRLGMQTFINSLKKVRSSGGTISLVSSWETLKDANGSSYSGSQGSNTVVIYGGTGHSSKVDDLIYQAEQFRSRHPGMSPRKQLEQFLSNEVREIHDGGTMGSYTRKKITVATGLRDVRLDVFHKGTDVTLRRNRR